MRNDKEIKLSFFAAHLTTIVSVSLVLLIMGIVGLLTSAVSEETGRLRGKLEVNLILADSISDSAATGIACRISAFPFVSSHNTVGKKQAMLNWEKETGENLETLFGVNPLSPEISLLLKAEYVHADSLADISRKLAAVEGVETVVLPDSELVENMNDSMDFLTLLLGGIALIMAIISFVLINNTVHLTIYSRRFTIHTMQLVGATNAFISRPIVLANMLAGAISGVFAAAVLTFGVVMACKYGNVDLTPYLGWGHLCIVWTVMVFAGALLCSAASAIATFRYLRKDYEELFS